MIKHTTTAGKSLDGDNIHPSMLKNLGPIAKTVLISLFDSCLTEHTWIWNQAQGIFLRKEGKQSYANASSFRPICITSYIGKLF